MKINKLLLVTIGLISLVFGANAFAKEIQISANNTSYSAEDAQKVASTALNMGVKEPVSLNLSNGNLTISGSSGTKCTFKVGNGAQPQIQGVSCK